MPMPSSETLMRVENVLDDLAKDVFVFPMSFAQQRMWFFYQLQPNNPFYNVFIAVRLKGRVNTAVMERSLNEIVRRHEILRTAFLTMEGQPAQVIFPSLSLTMPLIDLREFSEGERETKVHRLAIEQALQPFDLSQPPLLRTTLIRVGEGEYVFFLVLHHIVSDGWSCVVLMRELAVLYDAFSAGGPSPLPELLIQYADFTVWQREWLQGQTLETLLDYWKRQLDGAPAVLALPTDHPRPALQTFRGARCPLVIPKKLTEALKTMSEREGVTLFVILLAAFKLLLYRHTGQDNIVVGSPIANRNTIEQEGLIGFIANTLALRTDLSGNPTFRELLGRVQEVCTGAYAHQDLPFERLVEELNPERSLSQSPLFQVIFALQSGFMEDITFADMTLSQSRFDTGTVRFDLDVVMLEVPEGLRGIFVYSTDLFNASTIARMAGHFQALLEGIVANPEQRLSEFPLLTKAELQQMLVDWNNTTTDYPKDRCIHDLFEAQVKRTPDSVAVICRLTGAGSAEDAEVSVHLTYRELNCQADQLAYHLRGLGVGPDVPVGVCVQPSPESVVGLLSILKAGGTYVPLEARDPKMRLAFILQDAQIPVVVTMEQWAANFPEYSGKLVCLDSDWKHIARQSTDHPLGRVTATNAAYMLYTLGKGAPVEHWRVCNRLQWLQDTFNLSCLDIVMYKASLEDPVSVAEIFGTLSCGACLAIAPAEICESQARLQRALVEWNVSLVHFTPSALAAFVKFCQEDERRTSTALRCILCSGEPLCSDLTNRFFRCFGRCSLYNLYRLPEIAMEVTAQICQPDGVGENVPVGYPTPNTSIYVLDEHLQPTPVGVTGEVYVGGEGVIQGYLRDPIATAYRFIQSPFAGIPGERIFRTGDLGRWLDGGALQVLGSADRHAWINGSRVDLNQVEAALLDNPLVDSCVAMVKETDTLERELVAYLVPTGSFSLERLRAYLETRLPAAMRPHTFVAVSSLPFTPKGKINAPELSSMAIVDKDLVQRWEDQFRSMPEIEQAAVIIEDQARQPLPLHVSDLLLDWKRAKASPVKEIADKTVRPTGAQAETGSTRLSIIDGGPLEAASTIPATLPELLRQAVVRVPGNGVMYVQPDGTEIFQSYPSLLEEAERILSGLRQLGLKPQDEVIFQLDINQDFIPAFWGCVLGGFVPVPLSTAPTYQQSNNSVNRLYNAWEMLQHPVILTSDHLAPEIRSLSDRLSMKDLRVESIDALRANEPDRNWHSSQTDDLVLLLLTSGSTGLPKAVMQVHRTLLNRSAGTCQMNNHTRQDVSLNWMPLDHVGGIVMFHLRDTYLGCQQVHVPTDMILQNPLKWLNLIERYQATVTWAPNFAYGLINDLAEEIARRQWDLSSMRFILNGGEAIVPKTAHRFMELLRPYRLRSTAMYPAWGMSETCSGVVYSHTFSLGTTIGHDSFVEVGRPIPGVTVRIVGPDGKVVGEGRIGHLQIQGATITPGYYHNIEANQHAFTTDGWFDTGDLAFIRNGALTITGRSKDVIIIRGVNYYSHEIEAVVEEVDNVQVSCTAACAFREPDSDTDSLAIFFSPLALPDDDGLRELVKAIQSRVVQSIGVNPTYLIPVDKEEIPRTAKGTIQRAQLKQGLEAGEFDAILKRIDLLLGNSNMLPDWFYQKVWRREDAVTRVAQSQSRGVLVFLDRLGMGEHLCARLRELGRECVRIEAGSDFAKLGSDHYRLVPGEPGHYQRLIESLAEDGLCFDQILHLWTYDEYVGEIMSLKALDQAQDRGLYSVLFLVQALAHKQIANQPVSLFVVSSYVQPVSPNDEISYEKAPLLGLLKTIPREMPWLRCRHIDLSTDSLEANVACVLQEIQTVCNHGESAYRDKQRWVACLKKVDFSQVKLSNLPFKRRGMYILSGGFGGIGVEIARYLLEHYEVRLLVMGRTSLPDKRVWEAVLDAGAENAISQRIRALSDLEHCGGDIVYQAVDICEMGDVQQAVGRAMNDWECELDGIIHLAGVFQERELLGETRDSFAAVLRPKVLGGWVLYQLLKDRPQASFMTFSSVNGFFGGAAVGAYAAANSFLDAFSHYQQHKSKLKSFCFAWSMWDEVGMSRGYARKELSRAQGYYAITIEQGVRSWLAGMYRPQGHLLIGLDGSNLHIRPHVRESVYPIQKLTAYVVGHAQQMLATRLCELEVLDRFRTPSMCECVQIQEILLDGDGEVDWASLLERDLSRQQPRTVHVSPRTELEHAITTVWQEVLRVERVGLYDNFFDLGGNSLLVARVQSKLLDALGVNVSITELFQNPTPYALAKCLGEKRSDEP